MVDIGSVYARLRESVQTLATGAGTIQERLQLALNSFIVLSESDFPDEQRAKFRRLMKAQEGEIATMTADEAQEIAQIILELHGGVRNELERTKRFTA